MANELRTIDTSGKTVYAVITNTAGQIWNAATPAFETITLANWANYGVTLAEQATCGIYFGTFPAGIATQGRFSVYMYEQKAGAAVPADTVIATGPIDWTGTYALNLSVARIDLTQLVPTSNTAQTVGDSLNAARADGFGKWVQSGTTLTLYAADGTTAVRTFTLDSATVPQQRS